uniref:Putative RuvB domain containing protein n=1 Tax=viral metagenome TaxID=1070528 RepID=A0A6M3KYL1_9ZZZZ
MWGYRIVGHTFPTIASHIGEIMKFKNLFDKCYICGRGDKPLRQIDINQFICEDCIKKQEKKKNKRPRGIKRGWNDLVTPQDFKSYIGQEPIKQELNTILKATKVHGIPVQHVLFSGSFGLGKTTLARIFADMVGDNSYATAISIHDERDFPKSQVVIIDEIHTIREEEWLLTVMDKGAQTVLGATTTAGSLSGPLRSRFVSLVLQPYSVAELQVMVKGAAKNLKYDCPEYVSHAVARRGKTVARIALFLFKRVYDRIILNNGAVTPELLDEWFSDMKLDPDGLDNADRAYLSCLSDKPTGLQNIAAMTGLDRITLEETIEPYLLTHGFIQRTPRGRILGNKKPKGIWDARE